MADGSSTIELIIKARNDAAAVLAQLQGQVLKLGVGTPEVEKLSGALKDAINNYSKLETQLKRTEAQGKETTRGLLEGAREMGSQLAEKLGEKGLELGGILGLGVSLEKIVDAAVEGEKASAMLDAALKSTGGAAGQTKAQLLEMADALEKVSIYDSTAIQGSEALLLHFTNIREVFPQAQQTILDVASALGIDLKSATDLVGRALNNPAQALNSLRREGISFTEAQRAQIRMLEQSGQTVAAQRVILDALQKSYGGAAQAARDTFGGAMQDVKNAVSSLIQGDGRGLKDAAKSVNELADTLRSPEIKEGFAALVSGIVTAISWLAQGTSGIADFTKRIAEFYAAQMGGHFSIDDEKGIKDQIDALQKRRAILEKNIALDDIPLIGGHNKERLTELDKEIAALQHLLDVGQRLKTQGPPEAPKEKSAPPAGVVVGPVETSGLHIAVGNAEAAAAVQKAALARMQSDLDAQLKRNLISYADYYRQKTQLERDASEGEIQVKRAEIALAQGEIARIRSTSADADQAKVADEVAAKLAEITKLRADILALQIKSGEQEAQNNAALGQAADRLRQAREQFDTETQRLLESAIEDPFQRQIAQAIQEFKEAKLELDRALANGEITRGQYNQRLGAQGMRRSQAVQEANQGAQAAALDDSFLGHATGITSVEKLQAAMEPLQTAVKQAGDVMHQAFSRANDDLAGLIANAVVFGEKGQLSAKKMAQALAADLVQGLIKVGLQMAENYAISQIFGQSAATASASQAASLAASWAPAAFAASVATFGGADAAGGAAYATGLLTATALTTAASGVGLAGKRRYGGPVAAAGLYEVAEPGNPELLRFGNKTLLMMPPGEDGTVSPAKQVSSGAGTGKGVRVEVHNHAGAAVTPEVLTRSDGELLVRIAVEKAMQRVNSDAGNPMSALNRSLAGVHGTQSSRSRLLT